MECSKSDLTVERKLDHLDRFTRGNYFSEHDYEIPNLEGGIPILDQSLESISLVPTLEVPDPVVVPIPVVQTPPP